jgi:proteasome lid subunit RPN8/RPN11
MKLNDTTVQAFTRHTLAEYPKEACGLVIKDTYVPCINVHEEPTKHFRISPQQMVIEQQKGALQALMVVD